MIPNQLQFAAMRMGPGGEAVIDMRIKRDLAEAAANLTLFGAVLTTTVSFIINVIRNFGLLNPTTYPMIDKVPKNLAEIILCLVALSAATRAYRSGETIPTEQGSYNIYHGQIAQLQSQFDSAQSDEEKLRILSEVERNAEEELRRFLLRIAE